MNLFRNIFLSNRFYYGAAVLIAMMILSYPFPFLFPYAKTACILFVLVVAIDFVLLFNRNVRIDMNRKTPSVLSLGDLNMITMTLLNRSGLSLDTEILDELPEQFQARDFVRNVVLVPNVANEQTYSVRPLTRGDYAFGDIHLFIKSTVGFISRRISSEQ